MPFFPIVSRELLVTARRRTTYSNRSAIAGGAILITFFLLYFGVSQISAAQQGKALFESLSLGALFLTLFGGACLTADAISREKREGTLGFLFLTDLHGPDVVLGKLASSSLNGIYGLIAIFPILGLSLFLGGITPDRIALVALLLLNTLFFSMAAGIGVSSFSLNERKALFGALGLVAAAAFFPYSLGFYLDAQWNAQKAADPLLLLSPIFAYGLLMKSRPMSGQEWILFFQSVSIVHFSGWLVLGIASRWVAITWRGKEKNRLQELAEQVTAKTRGPATFQWKYRAPLLDRNPYLWLGIQNRFKAHYAWLVVAVFFGLFLWTTLKFRILSGGIEISLLFLAQILLKIWMASEICARFMEDRKSGALELVLSTPISVKEIVHGQKLVLLRQFGKPVGTLLLWGLLLQLAWAQGWFLAKPNSTGIWMTWASLILLAADFMALRWVGIWMAMTSKNLNRALAGTVGRVLVLPWILFGLFFFLFIVWRWTVPGPKLGTEKMAVWIWIGIGLAVDLYYGIWARKHVLNQFREFAAETEAGPSWFSGIKTFLHEWKNSAGKPRSALIRALLVRHWKSALALLIILVGIGSLAGRKFWHSHRLQRKLDQIVHRGEPITSTQFEKWSRYVLPRENAAVMLEEGLKVLVEPRSFSGPEPLSSFFPGINGKPFPEPGQRISGKMLKALQVLEKANQQAFSFMAKASALPQSAFPPEFLERPIGAPFFRLSRLSHTLVLAHFLAVEEQETEKAIQYFKCLLASARIFLREPSPFRPHGGVALDASFFALERMLSQIELNADHLQALTEEVNRLQDPENLYRAFVLVRFRMIKESQEPPVKSRTPNPTQVSSLGLMAWYQWQELSGERDAELLQNIQYIESLAGAARKTFPEAIQEVERRVAFAPEDSRGTWKQSNFVPLFLDEAGNRARIVLLQTALAMERFRSRTGRMPVDLKELAAQKELERIPVDPFDGKPIRYRPMRHGYKLYSIGPDRKDDGGADDFRFEKNFGIRFLKKARGEDITFEVRRTK